MSESEINDMLKHSPEDGHRALFDQYFNCFYWFDQFKPIIFFVDTYINNVFIVRVKYPASSLPLSNDV